MKEVRRGVNEVVTRAVRAGVSRRVSEGVKEGVSEGVPESVKGAVKQNVTKPARDSVAEPVMQTVRSRVTQGVVPRTQPNPPSPFFLDGYALRAAVGSEMPRQEAGKPRVGGGQGRARWVSSGRRRVAESG